MPAGARSCALLPAADAAGDRSIVRGADADGSFFSAEQRLIRARAARLVAPHFVTMIMMSSSTVLFSCLVSQRGMGWVQKDQKNRRSIENDQVSAPGNPACSSWIWMTLKERLYAKVCLWLVARSSVWSFRQEQRVFYCVFSVRERAGGDARGLAERHPRPRNCVLVCARTCKRVPCHA